jgi:hypothetical protein
MQPTVSRQPAAIATETPTTLPVAPSTEANATGAIPAPMPAIW